MVIMAPSQSWCSWSSCPPHKAGANDHHATPYKADADRGQGFPHKASADVGHVIPCKAGADGGQGSVGPSRTNDDGGGLGLFAKPVMMEPPRISPGRLTSTKYILR